MTAVKKWLASPWGRKAEHYAAVFAAAFGATVAANGNHILGAHGLDAVKSAAVGAVVAALKAGYDAVRAALPIAAAAPK